MDDWKKDRKNNAHTGAYCEHLACAWLIAQGYEVYIATSSGTEYDLLARNKETGEIREVDVTHAMYRDYVCGRKLHINHFKFLKKYVIVVAEDDSVGWLHERDNVARPTQSWFDKNPQKRSYKVPSKGS